MSNRHGNYTGCFPAYKKMSFVMAGIKLINLVVQNPLTRKYDFDLNQLHEKFYLPRVENGAFCSS